MTWSQSVPDGPLKKSSQVNSCFANVESHTFPPVRACVRACVCARAPVCGKPGGSGLPHTGRGRGGLRAHACHQEAWHSTWRHLSYFRIRFGHGTTGSYDSLPCIPPVRACVRVCARPCVRQARRFWLAPHREGEGGGLGHMLVIRRHGIPLGATYRTSG